jgi:hypothetical protein
MPDKTTPKRRFGFPGFALLAGIVMFLIQQGCQATSNPPGWKLGAIWFLAAVALVAGAVWFWDPTASHHWKIRTALTLFIVAVMGTLSFFPVQKQYISEHRPPTPAAKQPTPEELEKAARTGGLEAALEALSATGAKTPDAAPKVDKPLPAPPPPTFTENDSEVNVSAGSISTTIRNGVSTVHCLIANPCVTAYIKDHRVVVDASLYAGPGLTPFEIKGNTFTLRDPQWDRNYNDTAFEVVNKDLVPVLQIIYTTPHDVLIYGIFQSDSSVYVLSSNGAKMAAGGQFTVTRRDYPNKKLFKYPSRKYLGQEDDFPVPTQEPTTYNGIGDGQLCGLVNSEAKNIERLANQALSDLKSSPNDSTGQATRDNIRRKFSRSFQECCLNTVVEMHTELTRRVRPVDEQSTGNRLIDEMYFHAQHNPTGIILDTVLDIGHNLEALCGTLNGH